MPVQEHPDYVIENEHLTATIQHIQDFIDKHPSPVWVQAADDWSAVSARKDMLKLLEQMKQARQELYEGRVDFHHQHEAEPQTYYIGKASVSDIGIYAWQESWLGDLYYKDSYNQVDGKLLLKRVFKISHDVLEDIRDEIVDESLTERQYTDAFLLALLQQKRLGQLRDIVATIRARQYQVIKTPRDELVILQGVPGSGKTQIALHRVSYLLYNHPGILPNRVLILGPNPIFMHYTANVLPSLGNRRLAQRTFDQWLMERLGDTLDYETQDASLETLLDSSRPIAERTMLYRNARHKGSLKMAQLLERYVSLLQAQLFADLPASLHCEFRIRGQRWGPVTLSSEELRPFLELEPIRRLPFNQRRDEMERQLVRHISQEMASRLPTKTYDNADQRKEVETEIQSRVHQYFTDWRAENVSLAYRRLLRNPDLLRQAGEGIFEEWDLELLTQNAPTARVPFRFSDLAALLYLKILLDGVGTPYDHIVIDEAQDLTPLHFRVFYQHSRAGSMTILGDLAQSIYPHHGLDTWESMTGAMGGNPLNFQSIQDSYRSTEQIIEFANNLLRRIGRPTGELAKPIPRSGPAPTVQSFNHTADLAGHIIKLVQNEQKQGWQSIAIVGKTVTRCLELATELKNQQFTAYQLINDSDTSYQGQVVIIPAYLTKGLEFDVVILADAESYPSDTLHAHLLYVIITRAAHVLHVLGLGQLTPLLDQNQSNITLNTFLPDVHNFNPLTIEAFAASQPNLTADWYVERLAAIGRLHLLRGGKLDETILEILRQSFRSSAGASSEETILPLAEPRRLVIRNQVIEWQQMNQPQVQQALVFSELVYGLLRSTLQQYGLLPAEGASEFLADHIVSLATLLLACREQGLVLSASRGIGRKRALEVLLRRDEAKGKQLLDLLIEHSIVAENTNRSLIYVPQERVQGLLELSLGHQPAEWEQDFLTKLIVLPQPLVFEAGAPTEVSHD